MMESTKDAMSLVRTMYDVIDRQRWACHAALVSDNFRSILGSHDPMPFAAWQSRVKRIYHAFADGRHAIDFYAVDRRGKRTPVAG